MSYPFDQFAGMAGANRQLFMKLLDIARGANERQAQMGAKLVAGLSDQIKDPKGVATLPFAQASACLEELETNRQAVVGEAKAAFEEWQAETGALLSPEAGQEQAAAVLQNWSKLVLAPFELLAKAGGAQAEAASAPEAKGGKAAPATEKQG